MVCKQKGNLLGQVVFRRAFPCSKITQYLSHNIHTKDDLFIFIFSSLPRFHAELRSLLIASRAIIAQNAGAGATAANSNRTSELAAQFRLKPEDVALLVRYNVLSLSPQLSRSSCVPCCSKRAAFDVRTRAPFVICAPSEIWVQAGQCRFVEALGVRRSKRCASSVLRGGMRGGGGGGSFFLGGRGGGGVRERERE
jgi:hypothetical protein